MGQQQLLLIILGVIIVGIAVAVGITMFQDNAVDQNRSAVISDLTTLAAKAQQYYAKPTTLGGGGNSFVGLTADATGLGLLASVAFTNNANGTYTITVAGTQPQVTLHGVGKTEITTGVFPTYDMVVQAQTQTPTKIN
jgi:Tfp pilus assembly protein PilE